MKRIITTLFVFLIMVGVFAPISFSLAPQQNFTQTQYAHAQSTSTAGDQTLQQINNGCGVFSGSLGNCISYIFYFTPYWVGGVVLQAAARFLDITAALTLSSDLFTQSSFIQVGWALMRDIANIFFILMLLYIAVLIMIDEPMKGGGSPKKMIWSVILMAIFINFSMFVTDIVIDTSNTIALVFYNQINSTNVDGAVANDPGEQTSAQKIAGNSTGVVAPKQISLSLASAFHPQVLSRSDFWKNLQDPVKHTVDAGTMIPLLLMLGTLFFVVAWSFFVAGFSFMGRMVELFIIIIFSPIAFVSYIVPGMRGIERLGWSDWWKRLSDVAFAAPLYFMMLYLIALILNQGLFGGQNHTVSSTISTGTWVMIIVSDVMIPAIFLFIMLSMATKFVMKASGTIGSALGGAANLAAKGVGGFALGSVMGGGAAIGRIAGGRLGDRIKNSDWVQNNKTKTGFSAAGLSGWAARQSLKAGKGLQTSSFDVRQTKAGVGLSKLTGMNLESYGALSTAAAAGGFINAKARKSARIEKMSALIGHDEKIEKDINHEVEHKNEKLADLKKDLDNKKEEAEAADKEKANAKANLDQANKDLKLARAANAQNDNAATQAILKQAILKQDEMDRIYNGGAARAAITSTDPDHMPDLPASPVVVGVKDLVLKPKLDYENVKIDIRAIENGYQPERYPRDQNHPDYDADRVGQPIRRGPAPRDQNGNVMLDANGNPMKGAVKTDGSGRVNYTPPLSMHDPVTGQPNINPATGRPVTQVEVIKSQGVEGLKKLNEQVKTAPGKEFALNETKKLIKSDKIHEKRNALGHLTEFHFDPKPENLTKYGKATEFTKDLVAAVAVGAAGAVLTGGMSTITHAVGAALGAAGSVTTAVGGGAVLTNVVGGTLGGIGAAVGSTAGSIVATTAAGIGTGAAVNAINPIGSVTFDNSQTGLNKFGAKWNSDNTNMSGATAITDAVHAMDAKHPTEVAKSAVPVVSPTESMVSQPINHLVSGGGGSSSPKPATKAPAAGGGDHGHH